MIFAPAVLMQREVLTRPGVVSVLSKILRSGDICTKQRCGAASSKWPSLNAAHSAPFEKPERCFGKTKTKNPLGGDIHTAILSSTCRILGRQHTSFCGRADERAPARARVQFACVRRCQRSTRREAKRGTSMKQ